MNSAEQNDGMDIFKQYLNAQRLCEDLLIAHALRKWGGEDHSYHEDSARKSLAELAGRMGYRIVPLSEQPGQAAA